MGTAWTYNTDPNEEHDAVRERAGMFDMSPLKKVFVRGHDAQAVLDHLTTRDLSKVTPGKAAYLCVLTEQGGIADDAIVSNNGGDEWMIVHGSGDTMALLEASAEGHDAQVTFTDDLHDLSVQGPASLEILNAHTDIDLSTLAYFEHAPAVLLGHSCRISRTGYSGERGYEIFADGSVITDIWDKLVEAGVMPCSFTALDKVRIEAGLLFYGYDMTEDNTPWEVGLGFTVSRASLHSGERAVPRSNLPKGVHRVRRKVVSGVRYHFYAWRSGPKFWEGTDPNPKEPEFFHAFSQCGTPVSPAEYLTTHLVDDFLSSASLPKAERSKADIRKWLELFREEFGADPVAMFEERASRGEVNNWRKKWLHSPKQHDMAGTHATRVLNWAVEEGKLKEHHCHKLKKLYQSNRTEIIWTSGDIAQFNKHAPKWVQRILTAGCETGLRAADLVQVKMDQFEDTPHGKRLRFRTSKRGQIAYIPATSALEKLIAETPEGQDVLLVSELGRPLTARWASNQITKWRREAQVPPWIDGREKTLSDTRGTAATRLLNADLSLRQIAVLMGWSVRYAAQVIEHYAQVSPDESDAVLRKLKRAKSLSQDTKM